MHYFLLSALSWMGLEAINMYFCLIVVFMSQIRHLILKYMCFGWGMEIEHVCCLNIVFAAVNVLCIIMLLLFIDSFGFSCVTL